jgi:hypothetical protein
MTGPCWVNLDSQYLVLVHFVTRESLIYFNLREIRILLIPKDVYSMNTFVAYIAKTVS